MAPSFVYSNSHCSHPSQVVRFRTAGMGTGRSLEKNFVPKRGSKQGGRAGTRGMVGQWGPQAQKWASHVTTEPSLQAILWNLPSQVQDNGGPLPTPASHEESIS
ncbi:hypothetical protein GOP47_0000112 [Adiantum capillus-veneris]|uniref:Uncharacterized protein n=1 Tax=Adiantum capillus-veneris TaxID=13818 RepID=A0A9D4VEB5_ADICA|nr:hypothetical protein GOP47_0000112 [Adiantum capillus-veneris]